MAQVLSPSSDRKTMYTNGLKQTVYSGWVFLDLCLSVIFHPFSQNKEQRYRDRFIFCTRRLELAHGMTLGYQGMYL